MLSTLLRYLLPGSCVLCDLPLAPSASIDLCDHCLDALAWNTPACPRCAQPLALSSPTPHGPCNRCVRRPPPFSLALAPLRYEGAARTWTVRLKDQLGMIEGRLLGTLLAESAASLYATGTVRRPDWLLPVPLTTRRLARRGHNQAVTLAVPVARRLEVKLKRLGASRRHSRPPQRGATRRQRLANLEGVFASRPWQGSPCIAIVDDVMTTGATVAELARTLLSAGAGEVQVLAATRAVLS